jgi:uncharacterized membrane protein
MIAFLGAPALAAAAALVRLGRPGLAWIVVALGLYLVAFVVTLAVNVPLNDALGSTRPGGRGGTTCAR